MFTVDSLHAKDLYEDYTLGRDTYIVDGERKEKGKNNANFFKTDLGFETHFGFLFLLKPLQIYFFPKPTLSTFDVARFYEKLVCRQRCRVCVRNQVCQQRLSDVCFRCCSPSSLQPASFHNDRPCSLVVCIRNDFEMQAICPDQNVMLSQFLFVLRMRIYQACHLAVILVREGTVTLFLCWSRKNPKTKHCLAHLVKIMRKRTPLFVGV